jgi:hypothetical protein
MSAITIATHGIISEPKTMVYVPKEIEIIVEDVYLDINVETQTEIIINVEVHSCQ